MAECPGHPVTGTAPLCAKGLRGCHVLVVEDEYLLARELCDRLVREGASIIGPVPGVAAALKLLEREPRPALALLDVNLQGRMVWPVADALRARQIPFILVTGYDVEAIPQAYADVPRVEKPLKLAQILRLLSGGT